MTSARAKGSGIEIFRLVRTLLLGCEIAAMEQPAGSSATRLLPAVRPAMAQAFGGYLRIGRGAIASLPRRAEVRKHVPWLGNAPAASL